MLNKCKYLFICGAIASGIGKRTINSSIGMLLKQYGYQYESHLTTVPLNHDTVDKPDTLLVEVGGTKGDFESTCYYEAVRQMINNEGKDNVGLIMLTYILTLISEQKTKPAQNGIKDLRYTGLIADFIICRSETELQNPQKDKLAMFGNISKDSIFSVPNSQHIFDVPEVLQKQNWMNTYQTNLSFHFKKFLIFNNTQSLDNTNQSNKSQLLLELWENI